MSISYPLDFLHDFPGWTTEFELVHRQELSRQANGATIVKDMGDPLWRATVQSRSLRRPVLDEWRARLSTLEGGLKTFKAFPLSRCYPLAYPGGSWPTGVSFNGLTATVYAVGGSNKSLRVDLLPVGFVLRVGDYISIGPGDLHQVVETATADGSGITTEFEVRPHLWPGVVVDDLVHVKRPYCLMTVMPGTLTSTAETNGFGTISFQAMEAR